MSLQIETIEHVMLARFAGETLDTSNAKAFKSELEPLITSNLNLVLDLSNLKFVDSSGLGALLSCLRKVNSLGGNLKLCGMVKPVRALFELVRMHRVFEIFNTRDEAVRSYRTGLMNTATADVAV
jgi:anti-sigma B factor antagonist